MRTSFKLSLAGLSLLAVTALVFAACAKEKIVPTYATGAKVDCGGKSALRASGSTAKANAMARFIKPAASSLLSARAVWCVWT